MSNVAELIERLEGWLDYRPMQEFCSEALKDLREAVSSLAALERERNTAFDDAQNAEADRFEAEARERVLQQRVEELEWTLLQAERDRCAKI
jgi:hypothetical protein